MNIRVDDAHDGAQSGAAKRERDLHAVEPHGLHDSGGHGNGGGEQGNADDFDAADGERDHLWTDAGIFDLDGRRGLVERKRGERNVCLDDSINGARSGDG